MANELAVVDVDVYMPEVDPEVLLDRARKRSEALMRAVRALKLSVTVEGQEYLRFEAWQLLGAMYGVTAAVVEVTEERDEKGVLIRARAKAEARFRGTVVVSSAESECARDETLYTRSGREFRRWQHAADAQIKGMAQTRACARALRHCLAWVAKLAGFEPTPAEEISHEPEPAPVSEDEVRRSEDLGAIYELRDRLGWTSSHVRILIKSLFGPDAQFRTLTPDQRRQLILHMQQHAAKQSAQKAEGGSQDVAD